MLWSWKANTYDQATITENISLWEGVWSWKAITCDQATITENISLWEGIVVMKGQYRRSSYNNRKYFTLGGCLVLKSQYIRSSYNNRKYFTLGGCFVHYLLYNFTLGGPREQLLPALGGPRPATGGPLQPWELVKYTRQISTNLV